MTASAPGSSTADVDARIVVRRGPGPGRAPDGDAGFVLDVDLHLPAGRTTALLGPNGAGKSTALAVLAGLLPVDEGRVVIGGDTVDDPGAGVFVPAASRGVGVVFQDGLLFDHLDVLDNVAFGPRSRGASRPDARATARGWLGELAVAALAHRSPGELSGGQRQRVALARALASSPRLVLLDEPMSALDVQGRASLRRTLARHLATLEVPRLLVTHDPVEAFLLAERVAVLENGRLTQVGAPDEIRQQPASSYAAELVGTNLLRGRAHGGEVVLDASTRVDAGHAPATRGTATLVVADRAVDGPVLVAVHPHAIAISRRRPNGSPRNTWRTTVERVERLGDRCRVTVGPPLPVTAEVTPAAVDELGLAPGEEVHVSVKATEVAVTPDR